MPVLRTPKTTKLTAMERAKVDAADSAKPGDFRNLRAATRRSLQKLLFIVVPFGEGPFEHYEVSITIRITPKMQTINRFHPE